MNTIVDLNRVYQENKLFYWCNCCGEVNLPEDFDEHGQAKGLFIHEPAELPETIKKLYDAYQDEIDWVRIYTVSYDGTPGMVLAHDVSESVIKEILMKAGKTTETADAQKHSISKEIADLCIAQMPPFVTVFYGEDSDPDGDEVLVFIPEDKCSEFFKNVKDSFVSIVEDNMTKSFEHLSAGSNLMCVETQVIKEEVIHVLAKVAGKTPIEAIAYCQGDEWQFFYRNGKAPDDPDFEHKVLCNI